MLSKLIRGLFRVSQYPFKLNENMSIYIKMLLLTYFYHNSLNVLRPTFLNIYDASFSCSPSIGKMRIKARQNSNHNFYFISSCIYRFVVFQNFFSLKCTLLRPKQKCPCVLHFLNNLLLIAFVQNVVSKLVIMLQ